jgi:hypothetical protein
MTVALRIDSRDMLGPPAPNAHGVSAVLHYGFAHFAATCSCGWAGRRRYLKAAAQVDALQHAAHENGDAAVPFVVSAAHTVAA